MLLRTNYNVACTWQLTNSTLLPTSLIVQYPATVRNNLQRSRRRWLLHVRTSLENEERAIDPLPPPPTPPPNDIDTWTTWKTLTQLWAIVLPLGYAGVPLAAQALSSVEGGQAYAAAAVEVAVLASVLALLNYKSFTYKFEIFSEPKNILIGIAAGGTALLVNQLLFSSGNDATSDVSAVLGVSGPTPTAALFTASALLAPATEEIIYRGFFLGSLIKLGTPAPTAVVASALAFSVAHLQLEAVPQLTVVGLALGTAAIVSKGNVAAPFIGHAVYNGALFLSLVLGH